MLYHCFSHICYTHGLAVLQEPKKITRLVGWHLILYGSSLFSSEFVFPPETLITASQAQPCFFTVNVSVMSFGKCTAELNKIENWGISSVLRVGLAEMRVRNSKPVADCLTPVGWQVGMGKERGSNKVMGQHHRYSVLERQMQLQS